MQFTMLLCLWEAADINHYSGLTATHCTAALCTNQRLLLCEPRPDWTTAGCALSLEQLRLHSFIAIQGPAMAGGSGAREGGLGGRMRQGIQCGENQVKVRLGKMPWAVAYMLCASAGLQSHEQAVRCGCS